MRRRHKREWARPRWSRSGSEKKERTAETECMGEEKQKRVDSLTSRPHMSWRDIEVPFSYSAAAQYCQTPKSLLYLPQYYFFGGCVFLLLEMLLKVSSKNQDQKHERLKNSETSDQEKSCISSRRQENTIGNPRK